MKILLFIVLLILSCAAFGQTGRVISARDSVPLAGATVKVSGSRLTLVTDASGYFTCPAGNPELEISYVGYVTQRVRVSGQQVLILLEAESTALKEVLVATGYQNLPQERATGSFERVGTELLTRSVGPDILSRLDGVTTATFFDKRNSALTPLAALTIRGIGSIQANTSPLIVLDNFPYEGDVNNINPNDVASVTILKDAAAASIWGVRAGNGVIVITTKKGLYNQPLQVSLSSNLTSTGKPNLFYLPQMSSRDFIGVEKMLFANGFYDDDLNNTYSRPPVSPVVDILDKVRSGELSAAAGDQQVNSLTRQDVRNDYLKYIYRNGFNQQHALSLNGGSPAAAYYFSAGYDKDLYSLASSGYDRVSLKSNNTFRPLAHLEVQAGLQYTSTHNSTENSFSPYGYGELIPAGKSTLYPYARLADDKGNPLPIAKDFNLGFVDTTGNGKLLDWKYRPLQEAQLADNHTRSADILVNLGLSYHLGSHLSAEAKYQYERASGSNLQYYSPEGYYVRNLVNGFTQLNDGQVVRPIPDGGILDQLENNLRAHDLRGQLDYNNTFADKHELAMIAGAELRQDNTTYSQYRTYGYDPDQLTYTSVNEVTVFPYYQGLNNDASIVNPQQFGNILNRYVSLYANGSYTYDGRYQLSLSARKDRSNLFGVNSNQKGVPLWSAGLAWNLSKEAFYHAEALPYLRLRLTYGYSGNVDNNLSAYTTIAYVPTNPYTNLPYANVLNPPNPELRWERTGMLNVGLDFGSKNNRISGTVDFYRKRSKDLISPTPVDYTSGFIYLTVNTAAISGQGFDFQLNTRNLTGALGWNTAWLFSYNRNTVSKYANLVSTASFYAGNALNVNPVPGRDVYALYSYRSTGLDPENGDPRGYLNGAVSKDYNAIFNADLSTLHYEGSAVPVYFGAIRNTFTFRQFALSANITYKLGYYFRKASINYSNLFSGWTGNSDFSKRWQKSGDERTTSVPSMIYPADYNRDQFYTYSQATVGNAGNIRLQDVRLSYRLRKAELFAYAANLGILWRANHWGLDPDYGSGIPASRTYAIGLKANL